jgi:hypothetical protein
MSRCNICGKPLDVPGDESTRDCGGDCLRCMAEIGEDPDCIRGMIAAGFTAQRNGKPMADLLDREGDTMTKNQQALLDEVRACDGAEVYRARWPDAEALVKAGLITLGGARGPGGDWRRAEPADQEDDP